MTTGPAGAALRNVVDILRQRPGARGRVPEPGRPYQYHRYSAAEAGSPGRAPELGRPYQYHLYLPAEAGSPGRAQEPGRPYQYSLIFAGRGQEPGQGCQGADVVYPFDWFT